MIEGFFGTQGQTVIQNQQYNQGQFQSNDNDQDFDFHYSEPINYVSIEKVQQPASQSFIPDNEAIKRANDEQMRIQELLREKSNRQYQEKQKRRQQGQAQLQQFMEKKQRQTAQRKQENIQKQRRLLENNAKLSGQSGWIKVAANVPLKQGEYKGTKDTTRMRESIINKKNDETN